MDRNYCVSCVKHTNHEVLKEHNMSERGDYDCDLLYQIVKCLGCDQISFRKIFRDIEAAFPIADDEWEVPETTDCYPKAFEGHGAVVERWYVPELVYEIYSELLLTLKEDASILASLGLRATVEAVCNDLKITGGNLSVRINKLVTAGHISKGDAERLHGIRFMGNDAAHEIKSPKRQSLKVALKIVEHMLSSVYILEKESEGHLETVTSKYEVFERILLDKLKGYTAGDEYPIARYVGRDLRRVNDSISSLENELKSRIASGQFTKLAVGKVDHFSGSKDPLQHYKVI